MKRTILVLLAVSLGIVAVGCSGDDTPTAKTTTKEEALKQTAAKPGFALRKPNAAGVGGTTGGAANSKSATE
jgi:hypothetical protein